MNMHRTGNIAAAHFGFLAEIATVGAVALGGISYGIPGAIVGGASLPVGVWIVSRAMRNPSTFRLVRRYLTTAPGSTAFTQTGTRLVREVMEQEEKISLTLKKEEPRPEQLQIKVKP
jgi:hypothetical protein